MQAPTEQLRSDLRPCLDLRSRSAVLPTNGCSLDSPRLARFTSLGRGHASHHQRSHWSYPYMGFMRSALVSSTGAGSPCSRSRAIRACLQERMEGYGCGLWRLWPTEFRGTDRVGGSASSSGISSQHESLRCQQGIHNSLFNRWEQRAHSAVSSWIPLVLAWLS
jgi:hypothetical protein